MATREIIHIDEEKCDGCGDCVLACAEGAIKIIDGKARLISDTYCDGLGACLGECPQGALTIVKRDAPDFDEVAVVEHLAQQSEKIAQTAPVHHAGCPGSAMQNFAQPKAAAAPSSRQAVSQLGHWPVQLMLIPPHAPFLKNSDLLVCADCVPFTVPDFHARYLAGRAVLVGCPKLDDLGHYYEKLKAIFAEANPERITVLLMEVPCCGGIGQAAVQARNEVAPHIPLEIHTVGIQGGIHVESVPVEGAQNKRAFNMMG